MLCRLAPIVLLFFLAACGRGEVVRPVTPTVYISPRSATSTAQAQAAASVPTSETDAQSVALAGDAGQGEALFNEFQSATGFACATCHHADSEERLVGPGLKGISQRAASRVEGLSAVDYIHQSIVDPSAFVVPDYPDNLMPKVFGQIFTNAQINNLTAYLMTL